MSDSSSSSSHYLPAEATPSSTNFVDDALVTSDDERDSDVVPLVPWRSGADSLELLGRNETYVAHNRWPAARRRKVIIRRRRYTIVDEIGRDFFLIIALCFVLALLLIAILRPIALEILWYID